jgi:hypothetical protein
MRGSSGSAGMTSTRRGDEAHRLKLPQIPGSCVSFDIPSGIEAGDVARGRT